MADFSESDRDGALEISEKEKFLLRVSSITDLSVPPVILEQLLPILSKGALPEDFGKSKLLHDPSVVSYFLKKQYELESNRDCVFPGVDAIFRGLSQEEMYVTLSEMSPMDHFSDEDISEWKHAYSSHLLMHSLVVENGFQNLYYLVPLMLVHDIGKQALHHLLPESYRKIVSASRERKIPRSSAEQEVLGVTHAEAGAQLLKEWNFPEPFYYPVYYHHTGKVPGKYVLETALVQFVNWVDCTVRGIPARPLNRPMMTAAGIEEIDSEYWISRHRKTVAEINTYFEPAGIMNNTSKTDREK